MLRLPTIAPLYWFPSLPPSPRLLFTVCDVVFRLSCLIECACLPADKPTPKAVTLSFKLGKCHFVLSQETSWAGCFVGRDYFLKH